MKVTTFFKILNRKIEQYDKMATNPFTQPQQIIIVWVEDGDGKENSTENK